MKTVQKSVLVSAIALGISAASAQPVIQLKHDSEHGTSSYVDALRHEIGERYIVTYRDTAGSASGTALQGRSLGPDLDTLAAGINLLGGHVALTLREHNAIAAYLSKDMLAMLANDPTIASVEVDHRRYPMADTVPYGIPMVQADQLSDANAGNRTVCIIDSGLDGNHEDFNFSTISGTNDPGGTGNWNQDGSGHGTHVAGTIAALSNGIGVVGVLPSGTVNLHIVKVFGNDGWAYSSSLIDATNVCVNNGANVINMSLGGEGSSTTERNAFQNLLDSGVLSIAAAGNEGDSRLSYPASYDAVVSVAAVDDAKQHADFSQFNSQVELSGPGDGTLSTYPMGQGTQAGDPLTVNGNSYAGAAMTGSPQADASGTLVDCGLGTSSCTGASGNICLIQRGEIAFADKVLNCQSGGGTGVVIYNNEAGILNGTLGETSTSIPSIGISQADGQDLLANELGSNAAVSVGAGNYKSLSGTSMASPHVAGVAALVWSQHISCTASEIRAVLATTAEDLGPAGRDNQFGYGLVKAKDAVDWITANGCDGSGGSDPDPEPEPDPEPDPDPTPGSLDNGVPVANLAADEGSEQRFYIDVPTGASNLDVSISGGSGDADLYLRQATEPTLSSYDCRPYRSGNNESCSVESPGADRYHVLIHGYSAYSDVTLVASYDEPSDGGGDGGSFFENTNRVDIQDAGGSSPGQTASSTIDVTRSGDSGSFTVSVDIKHSYRGDLEIRVVTPDGSSATLKEPDGSDGANDVFESWTINGDTTPSDGEWRLEVIDHYRGDTGYIDAWSLTFDE